MRPLRIEPYCHRTDCKMNEEETCVVLNDTWFGRKGCPFYKPRKEAPKEENKNNQQTALL